MTTSSITRAYKLAGHVASAVAIVAGVYILYQFGIMALHVVVRHAPR